MITLKSANCSFYMDEKSVFTITTDAGTLPNCRAAALIDRQEQTLSFTPVSVSERSGSFAAETGKGRFLLEVNAGEKLTLRLSCELKAFPKDIELIPLQIPEFRMDHAVAQGRRMGRCANLCFPYAGTDSEYLSHFYSGIRLGKKFLLFSTPLRKCLHSEFRGKLFRDGIKDFTAVSFTCHEDLLNFTSDDLTIEAGDDLFAMTCRWSDGNVEVRKTDDSIFAPGWNSWDYYRWTITEEQVLANAEFIRRDPVLSKHIKRIILDDGWQYCYGDWEPNHYFPHGMKYLADEITKMGFEPGIWLAPALVEPHTQIAQLHPEWCAMGESGQVCFSWECMGRHAAVLDPTVPAVQKHLFDLFSRYADYGYRYFKLDFLYGVMQARQYHDRTVPHSDMIRKILEPIHKAVTGRALIMGCNFTYDSGNRYVDACRIGGDIHARWQNICLNSTAVSVNFWGTGRHWLSDPDFSLCRSLETSNDPELNTLAPTAIFGSFDGPYEPEVTEYRQVDAKEDQVKILLSLVLVSGGAMNLSDRMDRLNDEGVRLARKLVSAVHGSQGRPLDLYENEHAAQWIQNLPDGGERVLLINWSDGEKTLTFEPGKYGITGKNVTDFWNDRPVVLKEGKIAEKLAPRSCLLMEFR